MKQIFPLLFLFAATACGQNYTLPEPVNDEQNRTTASAMKFREGENRCYLTDFYPALSGPDSVTAPAGLQLIPDDPTWREFSLIASPGAPATGTLRIWKEGEPLAIVLQKETGTPYERMYTTGGTDNTVTVAFSKPAEKITALWQNRELPEAWIRTNENGTVDIRIPDNARTWKRSFLRVYASDGNTLYSDLLVPLKNGIPVHDAGELDRFDKHAQILYSLMIDRFDNGNPANDWKINSPDVLDIVDYQGGDLAGITRRIQEGYFDQLGITTLWISPITQNPWDAWGQNADPQTRFSGYHGYWPIYVTVLDSRFGTEEELEEMLNAAHEHGMNVILDYVSNHMHTDSPTLQEHPDWTTPLYLPDGRRNLELWDEQRLTTWFDLHIPSFDLERPEIAEQLTDSALYWLERFDFDGFRHDATKHIPESYWRLLTRKIHSRFPGRNIYQIGETYGSPELIGSYVKTGMMDAQFDFNVYDRAIWNIASPSGSMREVAGELENSLEHYGSHNLMGYITGNHDRPRFISLAGGSLAFDEDSKAAGWKRDITVGDAAVAYKKMALLEAFLMTIPGIPCIYQGDEYGVPGGNDPDNRRMMQFDGYTGQETELKKTVERLTYLRRNHMALLYGDYLPLEAGPYTLAFARTYLGQTALVFLNNAPEETEISIRIPYALNLEGMQPAFGHRFEINDGQISLTLLPHSFEIITN